MINLSGIGILSKLNKNATVSTPNWPGGEEANAAVCKTAIRGFESRLGLTN